jgi:REP-associated tyrosine transposase
MARLPRIDLPGLPQHLIVRGNNRGLMFRDDADRIIFIRYLEEALDACACDLHAYALMDNHVHLLATGHVPGELSELMQRIGRKFARVINLRWGRTGTLFEGRFRSSLVDSDSYLLMCMRYIELNPVRAGVVANPADYAWSSFRQNASGNPGAPLVAHALYHGLGTGTVERGKAYRELVEAGIGDADIDRIRESARKGRALGSDEFCAQVAARVERNVRPQAQGRPTKRGQVQKLT